MQPSSEMTTDPQGALSHSEEQETEVKFLSLDVVVVLPTSKARTAPSFSMASTTSKIHLWGSYEWCGDLTETSLFLPSIAFAPTTTSGEKGMSDVTRGDALLAIELVYDYYSARAVLNNFLKGSKLPDGLDAFDAKQVTALIAHLEAEMPRTQPAIDLLKKKIGGDGKKVVVEEKKPVVEEKKPVVEEKKPVVEEKKADDKKANDKKADDKKADDKKADESEGDEEEDSKGSKSKGKKR